MIFRWQRGSSVLSWEWSHERREEETLDLIPSQYSQFILAKRTWEMNCNHVQKPRVDERRVNILSTFTSSVLAHTYILELKNPKLYMSVKGQSQPTVILLGGIKGLSLHTKWQLSSALYLKKNNKVGCIFLNRMWRITVF